MTNVNIIKCENVCDYYFAFNLILDLYSTIFLFFRVFFVVLLHKCDMILIVKEVGSNADRHQTLFGS